MRLGVRSLGGGMQIAVIGTGNIGGTLGEKWRQAGHDVVYGSRRPTTDGPGGAPVGTIADAIAGAEVVLFGVPGGAVSEIVSEHAAALDSLVVIDATNQMGAPVFNKRDVITAAAPGAHYVRAFNTLGWENFADPLPDADLFFAAAPEARVRAELLISAVGLRPQYLGGAEAVATVDYLLPLWLALAKQRGGNRKVALRVVD
jgi:8-hydroxy-5-deazaflavin:NADPH oxidoreductase